MTLAEGLDVGEKLFHVGDNKWDETHCQCGIVPPFAKRWDWSNHGAMSDEIDIETVRENLRRAMRARDARPTTLSLQVGKNRTLVRDLLERSNDVQLSTLTRLASALEVPVGDLLAAPRVPIAGYIGAGGTIVFEDLGHSETVMRPPGISGSLVALAVRGSSMLPKYRDGDIIYIQRTHDGILPEYIGEDCAVRLVSGETYIKQLMAGSEDGRFTLLSLNADPMENVEVEWATLVRFVMPARSRQLLGS